MSGLRGSQVRAAIVYVDKLDGFAVGYRVSSMLSVGVDVSAYHFGNQSTFATLSSSQFGAVDPTSAGQGSTTVQSGSATTVGINAGAIVTINPKVRVGAVFRQGVAFPFTQVNTIPNQPTTSETGNFRTPYVIGGGVRLQPNDEFSIAIDYDRVGYSRLTQDFIAFQVDPDEVGRVSIPNGNEIHVGAEYTLVHVAHTPSIRAGVWFDPDHAVEYASDGTNSVVDQRLKATFPAQTGIWHYCFGAGMPLSRSYEFNVGGRPGLRVANMSRSRSWRASASSRLGLAAFFAVSLATAVVVSQEAWKKRLRRRRPCLQRRRGMTSSRPSEGY